MKLDPEQAKAVADRQDELSGHRRIYAIAAVSIGTMFTSIDNGCVSIALPTIARDLGITPSESVLLVTAYQLILIMTVLPLAALGDRIGHRAIYQYGQIAFVAGSLLCLFARNFPLLLLARGIQALGAAATFSVVSGIIRSIYPASRLGAGLALNTIVAASSASVAPTIGGVLLSVADWPWLFAINAPFALLSLALAAAALPDSRQIREPYDLIAAAMCAAMFGFAVFGLESGVRGHSALVFAPLIVLAAAIGFVFVRRELHQTRPILPIDLLRLPNVALGSIAALCASIGTMSVLLTLPFRLQHAYGYSPVEAGVTLAAWPLIMMFAAPASGALSDRINPGLLGSIGMAFAIAGMIALALLPSAPTHFDVIWRIAFAGLGFGLFYAPNARQIVGSASRERAAAAGALIQTVRMTGQVLGSTVAAILLALGVGAGPAPPLIATGLGVITGLCSLALLKQLYAEQS